MTAFSFISISIVEYIGAMVAMLALFRYPVSYYWPQIGFTSLICSVLSYLLSVEHDIALAPLIQVIVQAVCIWLMFNTPLLWSIIMCSSFLVAYLLFQGGLIYLLFMIGLVPPIVSKTGWTIYLIQLFCAGFCWVLGRYWQRKGIGFLFIPTSRDEPYVWSKAGKLLFAGSILSFIAFGTFFEVYSRANLQWYSILLIILLAVTIGLLYIMKRKNKEYVE